MVRFNIFYMTGMYKIKNLEKTPPKRLPQYGAAFTACLSASAFGAALAWTSPAGPLLEDESAGFPVSLYQLSVIGSLMPIGAAVSSVPIGYLTDKFGRKTVLLSTVPLILVGWFLIIWAASVEMMFVGRFITGMCSGAICVTAPVFTSEIAQKEIRGELASYFQLLLSLGIVLVFAAGSQFSVFHLSIICAVFPIIFGVAFVFFPETPVYYIIKGRRDAAEKSLKFYRGENYDVQQELSQLEESMKERSDVHESAWDVFLSKQGKKALYLSILLMVFQQLCGINACTFYSTTIFQNAGSSLEPKYATIIVGIMQFAGTLIGMLVVDRVGRVALLGTSAAAMAISTSLIGGYFLIKDYDIMDSSKLSWVPLLGESIFVVMFSVGYGPIPWALLPEINPPRIVGIVQSVACVFNWVCAFLVTKFFPELVEVIGPGFTFLIFTLIGTTATVFSYKSIPETKGKSLEEIQLLMSR